MDDTFLCENCYEEWGFIPEDFDYEEEYYPTLCPHCEMSFLELVENAYRNGGIPEVIDCLLTRYVRKWFNKP